MRRPAGKDLREIARNIRLLVLDVDGVLTDGSIILDNEGNELKRFHVRDGHGIKMLRRAGIEVALITGRYSKVVERRAQELGITEVYQRCHDKSVAYEHILEKLGFSDGETAYMGDDIVDVPLLNRAGLSVAVSDAEEVAKASSMMVTESRGGRGAVREVTDLLLKARGLWDGILDEYSKA
jgi:3-deoxy-D-manno-octulosonate 8-phosphate phosphatase (KDO 8-P phosphatase)